MANTQQQSGQGKKFDVNIYTEVRVKVCGIDASSHLDAIQKAEQEVDLHGLFLNNSPGYGASETEWAEFTNEYVVDEVDDEKYRHSTWYKWKDGEIVPYNAD